ncbi:MAG: phosphohydrolase, partial [Symploca sp. SIO1B1]|nr:phosphohydrolase [Symploca sp. SIO1B1]
LHDYRRLGDNLWECFHGGKDGTLWYYRSVLEAFLSTESTPLVEELERVVEELESLVGIGTEYEN